MLLYIGQVLCGVYHTEIRESVRINWKIFTNLTIFLYKMSIKKEYKINRIILKK